MLEDKAGRMFAFQIGSARSSMEIKKRTINQGKQTDGGSRAAREQKGCDGREITGIKDPHSWKFTLFSSLQTSLTFNESHFFYMSAGCSPKSAYGLLVQSKYF